MGLFVIFNSSIITKKGREKNVSRAMVNSGGRNSEEITFPLRQRFRKNRRSDEQYLPVR